MSRNRTSAGQGLGALRDGGFYRSGEHPVARVAETGICSAGSRRSNRRIARRFAGQAEIGAVAPQVDGVPTLREAAVVLAIFADPPHRVVFVERAAHLRDHPGQIGLPGGSVDAGDGDDRARTALRELHEELGIDPQRVEIVARLPAVAQRVNTFRVTPVVGILQRDTPLVIDPAETAAVFTVPLAELIAPGAVHPGIETVGELAIDTWVFDYEDRHVWGLTARMLRDFVVAWNLPDSPIRAAIEGALHAKV